ncbi:MAG: DNA repair protein RadA [Spirochaetes bacterium]|nr:DNA repair protein RadA [Spirochaetota bacterium]MBU0954530.1 DNA repair protein RadA [Spirochaetota bacterium]
MAVKSGKAERQVFECSSCGHQEGKWLGRCPACGEWNTLLAVQASKAVARQADSGRLSLPLSAIDPSEGRRIASGSPEVDRVLGGGLVPGSTVLVGGEPGIGKSTLLLQLAARAEVQGRVLYVSGEEGAAQLRLRADRLGLQRKDLEIFCSGDLAEILVVLERLRPALIIIDSLQTLLAADAGAVPGTANQVKYCSMELSDWARSHGASCFMVAHVTKDGLIAGPKAAEHIVDVVLMFEQSDNDIRFLRSSKNRFGSTDEIALFSMSERGLQEVNDPASIFLVRREGAPPPGIAVAASWEGTRCLLVEIQALTVASKAGLTRVYSERIDSARVSRVAAVLEKHAGIKFSDQDIYVNVAGGMRLSEPGIDAALAAALYSARSGLALPAQVCLAGEVSLAGELRSVQRMQNRVKAAANLGFSRLLGPPDADSAKPGWTSAGTIKDLISKLFS